VGSRAAGKNNRGDLQRLPPLFIVFAGGDNHRDLLLCFRWPAARRNYLERGIAVGERNSGGWPYCCLSVAVTVEETEREEDLLKWGELRWFL
jgi:hypothetical protein